MRVVRLVVTPAEAGRRVDQVLAARGDLGSRARVQLMLRAGRVRVNGVARKPSYVLRPGDTVTAAVEPAAPAPDVMPVAAEKPLDILYEDGDVLVVNKPAGVVVHPAPGHRRDTLVNGLLHHLGGRAANGGGPDPGEWTGPLASRPGIVHRLDKDTSGALVVAKSLAAHEHLARQFRERTVTKEYLAVVRGRMPARDGLIDRPIGRHPRERQRMSVRSRRGRSALTRYAVRADYGIASVVRLLPTTGRTHQLRVHLAAAGHPIVGDRLYGRSRSRDRAVPGGPADALAHFARQALHASRLEFSHPRSGERVRVRAPLPADLRDLLALLRASAERGSAAATKPGSRGGKEKKRSGLTAPW
jgi:23S rRNA pseudouridine1911/1915/1917 synthase